MPRTSITLSTFFRPARPTSREPHPQAASAQQGPIDTLSPSALRRPRPSRSPSLTPPPATRPRLASPDRTGSRSIIEALMGGDCALERGDWLQARKLWATARRESSPSYAVLDHLTSLVDDSTLSRSRRTSAALHLMEFDPRLKKALWTCRPSRRRLENASANDPSHLPLKLLLAIVNHCHQRPNAARNHLAEICAHADTLQLPLTSADLDRLDNCEDSLRAWANIWTQVHAFWPEHPLTRYAMVLARANAGEGTWAEAHMRALAADEPSSPVPLEIVAQTKVLAGRWDEALAAWREALVRDTDRALTYLGVGVALLQLGDAAAAEAHFFAFFERQGESADSQRELALWLTRGPNPQSERAAVALQAALEHLQSEPDTPIELLCLCDLIDVLMRLKRPQDTLELHERVLALTAPGAPERPNLHLRHARSLWDAEHQDDALGAYAAAMADNKAPENVALEAAELLTAAGRHADALDWLRRAEQVCPANLDILALIGCCLLNQARNEEASEALERARALGLGNASFVSSLAAARHLVNDEAGAKALLEEAIALAPHRIAKLLDNLLVCLMRADQWDAAQSYVTAARTLAPDDIELLTWQLQLCAHQGDFESAQTCAERIVELDRENVQAWRILLALAPLGSTRHSTLECLRELRRLVADDAELAIEHATHAHYAGLDEEALSASEAAYNLSPDHPDVLQTYSAALRDVQEFGRAANIMRRAIELDPDTPRRLPYFAQILFLAGEEDALEYLRRALDSCTAEELEPVEHILEILNSSEEEFARLVHDASTE